MTTNFSTINYSLLPFTSLNPLYNHLVQQKNVRIHNTTGYTTGCKTCCVVYTQL